MLKGFSLTLLAGLFYAFGFPRKDFFHSFILAHCGLFLYFYALEFLKNEKISQKLLLLLGFSLSYNLFGYYWIPETLKEFGGLQFPINYLLGTLFSLIIAPHLLVGLLTDRFVKRSLILRALMFTLLEYFIPQQFPAHLGHTWLDIAPYLSFGPIFGAPFYSFLGFIFIFMALDFFLIKKIPPIPLSFTLLSIILSLFNPLKLAPPKSNLPIRMVQANIGNLLKVEAEKGIYAADGEVRKRYQDLSLKETGYTPRLIIWPETALPNLLSHKVLKKNKDSTPFTIKKVTRNKKSYLFTGGYDMAERGEGHYFETQYNTAFLFNQEGGLEEYYHKSKLIPFGESLPFGPLNSYLVNLNPNIAFFAQGERFPLFNIDDEFFFTSAICYEILFSSFMRSYLNRHDKKVDFIINITNDSWYGDTSEPYQHKFLSHWRALEFQVPLVRMTNTGISNVLYPDGSETKALYHGEKDILDIDLKVYSGEKTIFQRYGIFVIVLLALFLLLLETFFNKVMQAQKSLK